MTSPNKPRNRSMLVSGSSGNAHRIAAVYPAYRAAAMTQRALPNATRGFETSPDSITTSEPELPPEIEPAPDGASVGMRLGSPASLAESAKVTSALPSMYTRIARTRSLLYRSFTKYTLRPKVNIALDVLSIELEVTDVYKSE